MYRQGDVWLRPVGKIPSGLKKVPLENGRMVLMHGEATGHAHVIEGDAVFLAADLKEMEDRFLKVEAESILVHDEHDTITIPPGQYEVRRVMMERFGAERLMREAQAELVDEVHEPPFPGLIGAKLWLLEVEEDEPLVMLECRNSTPEPDGSYKPYWLRVPPSSETAHGAIAWTFGETESSYQPLIET